MDILYKLAVHCMTQNTTVSLIKLNVDRSAMPRVRSVHVCSSKCLLCNTWKRTEFQSAVALVLFLL